MKICATGKRPTPNDGRGGNTRGRRRVGVGIQRSAPRQRTMGRRSCCPLIARRRDSRCRRRHDGTGGNTRGQRRVGVGIQRNVPCQRTMGRRSCCPLITRRRDSRCRRRHLFFGFHVLEAETATRQRAPYWNGRTEGEIGSPRSRDGKVVHSGQVPRTIVRRSGGAGGTTQRRNRRREPTTTARG